MTFLNLENKLAFYFRNTKKDIILSENHEKHYRNTKTCRFAFKLTKEDEERFRKFALCQFCEIRTITDKLKDSCQLTGKYRGPAKNKCFKNYTQKRVSLFHFISINLVIMISICYSKSWWKKNEKVKPDIIPEKN